MEEKKENKKEDNQDIVLEVQDVVLNQISMAELIKKLLGKEELNGEIHK
jgi:hypothetical protein